jgi:aryl-alcohol dehydrogenase-like predicted oxidoreductase
MGTTPYFSLTAGFMTGKYRSQQDAANAASATAVLQSLYTETATVEWLFPQEKATFLSLV